MEEIITFLVDNWQPILSAILSLVAVILVIVKKRPVVQSLAQAIDYVITNVLPSFIIAAEKTSNTGDIKKQIVINHCLQYLGSLVKLDDDGFVFAAKRFGEAIERVLTTPQKKV